MIKRRRPKACHHVVKQRLLRKWPQDPKANYRFNIIPTKFPMPFFTRLERGNPRIHSEAHKIMDSQWNPDRGKKSCWWGAGKLTQLVIALALETDDQTSRLGTPLSCILISILPKVCFCFLLKITINESKN